METSFNKPNQPYSPTSVTDLRNEQQILQCIWDGVGYGIFILDVLEAGQEFRYSAFNRAFRHSSPIPVEQLLGKTLTQALPKEMAKVCSLHYWQCLNSGQTITFEQNCRYNEQEIWWQFTVNPIIEHNKTTQLVVTVIDISDRVKLEAQNKQTQAQLKKSQQRFEIFCNSTPTMAIQGYDSQRRVIFWNQASEKFYGYTQAEAWGRKVEDLIIPNDAQAWLIKTIDTWMRGGEAIAPGEMELRDKQDKKVSVYANHLLLENLDDEPEMYCLHIDLSERKQQENALRFIVEGIVSKTGQEFFHACVQHLAEICQTQYAFITQLADETFNKSKMLALWNGEEVIEPYEFNLLGTPCSVVFQEKWGIFANNLTGIFPEADSLATLGAESYLGIVIVDSQGRKIGNLGIIDTKPLPEDISTEKMILQLFASRVGAEMERYAAQQKVEEQEQFLRTVYEGANQPIFVVDVLPDGEFRYVGWNKTAEIVTGIKSEEIRGRTPEQVHGLEVGKIECQRLQECLTKRSSDIFESELELDGKETWWITTINPIQDSQGKIYRFIGTTFDISGRKIAERKLRQNEEKYHQILDAITDLVLVKGRKSQIVWANRAFRDYYNMTEEEIQGIIDADYNAEYTPQYLQDDAYVFATGQVLEVEEPITRYDGKVLTFNTIKCPIYNEVGEIILIVGVSRDITERKAAQTAIKEYANQQTLLNQLINQIRNSLDLETVIGTTIESIRQLLEIDRCAFAWYLPDAMPPSWEVIQDKQIQERFSILGVRRASLVGPIEVVLLNSEIIRIDNVEEYSEPIHREYLKNIGCQSEILLPIHTHAQRMGIIICLNYHYVRPWSDSEIEILKAVSNQLAVAIDQAELYAESRIKSEELQQALATLQLTQVQMLQTKKMSSLGQLVAGIAHEINNPVNFIYGNISYTAEYASDLLDIISLYQQEYPIPGDVIAQKLAEVDFNFISEDLPKILASMKVGAERIREIVKSLRSFSRLDEAEFKPVNIHDGIDSALMILQNRLQTQSDAGEIQIMKNYGTLPEVECFAGQLNQVFLNILMNAIDALEERAKKLAMEEEKTQIGMIKIITKTIEDNQVCVQFIDNGIGIPVTIQEKVFDPFFTTKPVGKGTGMGMSISYQIVEKHGGSLECFSTPQEGTEFRLRIPIRQVY